jgi:glutaredoxin
LGRRKEFKEEREFFGGMLDKKLVSEIDKIRGRENADKSEVLNRAMLEYVNAHKEGNETFKLDEWTKNAEFQAVPTIFADNEKWTKYVDDCDKKESLKLLKAVTFVREYIQARMWSKK